MSSGGGAVGVAEALERAPVCADGLRARVQLPAAPGCASVVASPDALALPADASASAVSTAFSLAGSIWSQQIRPDSRKPC